MKEARKGAEEKGRKEWRAGNMEDKREGRGEVISWTKVVNGGWQVK